MMDKEKIEQRLSELPLYIYGWIGPEALEFYGRIRWICEHECPMYGLSWACPPGVGSVGECQGKCLRYENCLMISTIPEVADIAYIYEPLATRGDHEAITNQVGDILREAGLRPDTLPTEACALRDRCAILDGQPCRFPEKMHPCVESHGINVIPILEEQGLAFQYGENVVTWISLLFC